MVAVLSFVRRKVQNQTVKFKIAELLRGEFSTQIA